MSDFFEFDGTVIPTHTADNGEVFYQVQTVGTAIGCSISIDKDPRTTVTIGRSVYANRTALIDRLKRVGKKTAKEDAHRMIAKLAQEEKEPEPVLSSKALELSVPGDVISQLLGSEDVIMAQKEKVDIALNIIQLAKKFMEK